MPSVAPLAIIDLLDEAADHFPRLVGIAVAAPIHLLLLERFHKALRLGIVVRIADPAHARLDIVGGEQGAVLTARILHAAIGMMDEAAGTGPACNKRHGECRNGQARLQMRVQRPADHAPAERVEHDGKESELLLQADIGDVRHPQLIEIGRHHPTRQVRHHPPAMAGVGRHRHEGSFPQAQQIVLAHQAQHPLVVHGKALATQLRRDPAVPIVRMLQCQALDGVAYPRLFLARRRGTPVAVVPGPAHTGERAHPLDREFALRQGGRHRLDDFVDPVTPGPALGRRAPLTCRKACRKKSSSTCCWPTLRSSAAMRLCAFSSSPAAPGELDPPPPREADRSELRGRPGPRRASGPPQRKRSRQMYKSLLENCSSRANARIFSPASIRLTIPSLNARLKTRCDDFGLDIRSPMENCPLFSVSHFWGALQSDQGIFSARTGNESVGTRNSASSYFKTAAIAYALPEW